MSRCGNNVEDAPSEYRAHREEYIAMKMGNAGLISKEINRPLDLLHSSSYSSHHAISTSLDGFRAN